MPWTTEVWVVWVACTFPIGAAIATYAASHLRCATRHAVAASLVAWMLLASGTAISFIQPSFSARIIAMDCGVNLIGMLLAALALAVFCSRIERGARLERSP